MRAVGEAALASRPVIVRLLQRHWLRFAGAVFVLAGVTTAVAFAATSEHVDDDQLRAERPELDAESEATPAPEPPPEPERVPELEPEPDPDPVEGNVERVEVQDLSATGTGLYQPGSDPDRATDPDEEAIDAFVSTVVEWLDAALTAANLDDGATVGALGAGDLHGGVGMLDLGTPGEPVVEASYAVTVAALGAPQWGEVRVRAVRADGTSQSLRLVVSPGADGPHLVAAQEGPDDEVEEEAA